MKPKFICIVIPCLNEEVSLYSTCTSLGFASKTKFASPRILVIVDNGSSDATLQVAYSIQEASSKNTVYVVSEPEKGYVPPRHTGNNYSIKIAESLGYSHEDILLVQADADTIYCDGYIDALRFSAECCGLGTMIVGCMYWPQQFRITYPQYINICNSVDEDYFNILTDQKDDVIIDDKVCAYHASDYYLWGGHQREYNSVGDEIFAETTRLYIRALSFGANRYLSEDAKAFHSARKVLLEPILSFITAGFPRSKSFNYNWKKASHEVESLEAFLTHLCSEEFDRVQLARKAHLQGLFEVLPAHVARTLNKPYLSNEALEAIMLSIPYRSNQSICILPGIILEDIFSWIDSKIFPRV